MENLISFLKKYSEKVRQYQEFLILIAVAFVIILTILVLAFVFVLIFPIWQVSHFGINDVTVKATIENQYRTTLIQIIATFAQILGGIAIGIGIYFAWKNVTISQESQITERFTRAIDQLGNPAIEIRLGGIYALERISNESEKDYWPIMEILTAYIRKNSPEEVVIVNKKVTPISMDIQANEDSKSKVSKVREMTLDIQATLIIISKRKYYLKERLNHLNLQKTYLRSAELNDTYLENADFTGSYLRHANFMRAHLEGAIFAGADLDGAIFFEAQLEGSNFFLAQPIYANFTRAQLKGADFAVTQLEGSSFNDANLEGADFYGADLRRVYGLSVDQLSKVETLYKAKLDDELLIPLKEKYPALFEVLEL